jgi:hypothetical protein
MAMVTFRTPTGGFNVLGGATYLAAGDFNKDGKLDLALIGAVGLQIVLGNGDGTFRGSLGLPGLPHRRGRSWWPT